MRTAYDWAYVIAQGPNTYRIQRASTSAVTVQSTQPGVYVVSFPAGIRQVISCVASLNNSVGYVTAVPGDSAGIANNQVSVMTMTTANSFSPSLDFTVIIYYKISFWKWLIKVANKVERFGVE